MKSSEMGAARANPDIYALSFNREFSSDREERLSEQMGEYALATRKSAGARLPRVSKKLDVHLRSNSSKDVTNAEPGHLALD